MHKLTILFRTPPDISAFEEAWSHNFVPFAEAMPGILRVEVSHIEGSPTGPAEFYKTHEFYFADRATMDAALRSDSGTRAGYTLRQFAHGLYTLLFADVMEDVVRPGGTPPELKRPA